MKNTKRKNVILSVIIIIALQFIGMTVAYGATDTTPPTASSVVAPVTTTYGTTFSVNAMNVTDSSGVASVKFAVWSKSNQSDLLWYQGSNFNNGNWGITANIANHSNNRGTYTIHVYAKDYAGNEGFIGGATVNVLLDTTPPSSNGVVSAPSTAYIGALAFTVSETGIYDTQSGVASVRFAVWSKSDQSDLKWLSGTNNNGTWSVQVNPANFNNNTGKYYIDIYAKDNVGNEGFVGGTTVNVTTDTTAPRSNGVVSAPSTAYIGAPAFTVSETGIYDTQSGVASVRFAVWSKSDQSDLKWLPGTNNNGTWSVQVNPANFNNNTGKYYIDIYAKDYAGNEGFVGGTTVNVTTDTTAPRSNGIITAPSTAFIGAPAFTVSETGIYDTQSGVASVIFAVWSKSDQSDLKWLSGTNNNGTWSVQVNPVNFNNNTGKYYIDIYAKDNVGNEGFVGGATVNVVNDTTLPTTNISAPANNGFIKGTVAVNGTASDTYLNSWTLEYGEGTSPTVWTQINTGTASVSNGNLGSWDTSSLKNNTVYTLRIRAADGAGNTNQASIRVTTDKTLPETSITSPAGSAVNGTVTVKGTVTDTNIRSWTLEYGLGESPAAWTQINAGTTSVSNGTLGSWDTGSLTDGAVYTLRLRATDAAGNTSQATVLAAKDSTEPTTVITSPASDSFVNGIVAVKGTAADTNMGNWALEYGEGASPTEWMPIHTGTASMPDGVLGYWDTGALTNESVYTLRLSATDTAGNTSQSNYRQVTIDSFAPGVPANLSCSFRTQTTVFLKWDASEDNIGVAQYRIYRDGAEVGGTEGTNYIDSGLIAGSACVYEIKAEDKAGNLSAASQLSVTLLDSSGTAPATPASAYYFLTEDTVNLKWTASVDDGVSGYEVLRDYQPVGFTASANYTDDTAEHGKEYNYQIYAVDESGNYSESYAAINGVLVASITSDTTPPSAPGITSYDLDGSSVVLHWSQSTDNVGVAGYVIYRNGNEARFAQEQSYTDANLSAGQQYSYSVKAMDANGNLSEQSNTVTFVTPAGVDTTAPSMPGNLTCTINSGNTVDLSWDASTDNVGIKAYGIVRNGEAIGTAMSTAYTDSTAEIGQMYIYIVGAIDPSSNIGLSFPAVILVGDQTPPTTPQGLEFASTDGRSAVITWKASTDNVSVTEYEVYRDGNKIGNTAGCAFTDGGFITDTRYVYTIKAKDAAGNVSGESSPVSGYMPDVFAPTEPGGLTCSAQTETSVTLAWPASTDNIGVTGYEVYRDARLIGDTAGTTYTDDGDGLSFGNTYVYTVKAKDAAGNVSNASAALSVKIEDLIPPSAPSGLVCTSQTEKTVTLSWTEAADNAGVTRYDIYRDGAQVGSTAELTYTDRGLAIKTYAYTVKAQDAEGNVSNASNTLSVTTADITAPSVPADLKSTSITDTSVTLEWAASMDNGGIAGYDIYKDGTKVADTTGTTYSVNWLTTGQTYSFYVRARDIVGNISGESNAVSVLCDSTAPSVPGNLACGSKTDSSAAISWNASTDNVGVAGYDIYRNGEKTDTTTSTTYTDDGVSAGSYAYSVKAADGAGNESGFSTTLNVTITDANPPVMGWVTPTSNTTSSYEVFNLSANGVYDPAGVSSVLFSVYNAADGAGSYLTYPGVSIGGGVWTASFDASKYTTKTGAFILSVRGTDKLGNAGDMGSSQFYVGSSGSSPMSYQAPMALMEASGADASGTGAELQTNIKTNGGTVTVTVNGIPAGSTVRMVLHGMNKAGRVIDTQGVTVSLGNQGDNWLGSFDVAAVMGGSKGSIQIDLIETDANGIQTDLGYYTVAV